MTIDDVAMLLRSPARQLLRQGFYSNQSGQSGYFAEYQVLDGFVKYSVSATDFPFAPDEVFMAITGPRRWIQRANRYCNKRGRAGFEATVHSAGHAFMITAATGF